jgi:hypothetical protein
VPEETTPLVALAEERTAAAEDLDTIGDEAQAAVAAQLAAVSPEASALVLRPLVGLVEALGGKLEGVTVLGDAAVARALGAIADAVEDAAAEDVVDDQLVFQVADLVDDQQAKLVAGKLSLLGKDKAFLRWLKTPAKAAPPPAAAPPAKAAPPAPPVGGDEAFLASRMR